MFAVCLLTLNASPFIERWIDAIQRQSLKPDRVLVMDSMSTDGTADLVRRAGFELVLIPRIEFGHGRTRQLALEKLAECDFVVFMTQDALLAAPDSLSCLLRAFDDSEVDVAYGRQLPHLNAGMIARHARAYNYPAQSEVRTLTPGNAKPGIHVAFCSDSFAAYRVGVLLANGGFPHEAMFGEDMIVTARCLLRFGKVAYVAEATAHHSHDYSIWQDFRRYFDTGVFHKQQSWLIKRLGRAEGRGATFVVSELRHVLHHAPWRIPEVLIRTLFRYTGYRAGLAEHYFPLSLKRRWSMSRQF